MKLDELISVLPFVSKQTGLENVQIHSIETDSRYVTKGSLFICLKGFETNGHLFVNEAIERGAAAIIAEEQVKSTIPVIYVDDTVRSLAILANHFYSYPSLNLPLIGITGTNGKTTVSYLLEAIYQEYGKKTGVIGTIGNKIGSKKVATKNTTPDALALQQLFQEMKANHVEQVIMEVSSHALELGRVNGCDFNTVVFTNLSQDHLDFHQTEANYFRAKSLLFSQLGNTYDRKKFAILNADDDYASLLKKVTSQPVLMYGMNKKADITAENIELFPNHSQFRLKTPEGTVKITSRLTGKFNVYNMLAASAAALANKVPLSVIQKTFENIHPIPGRFEQVKSDKPFTVIVDYAHTPDALENILKTSREITKGKLYCVLGCGGDRDRAKRPLMAEKALQLADFSIFTSDNPRSESPELIIEDMLEPVSEEINHYEVILNRKEAIIKAIEIAKQDDLIVIAGKGHETYQEINGEKNPFDDRLVAIEAISQKEL